MVQTKHIQVNPRMGIDSLCTLPSTTQPSYNAKLNMLAILDLKKKTPTINRNKNKQTCLAFKGSRFITRIWSWREQTQWDKRSSGAIHLGSKVWHSYLVGTSTNEQQLNKYLQSALYMSQSVREEIGKPRKLLFSLWGNLVLQKNTRAGHLDSAEVETMYYHLPAVPLWASISSHWAAFPFFQIRLL